ncbi:MAG: cysteine hydrolase family protein [Victivallaceae bacterium]|nr:cysteine hydrolase family protein [Victivallaceae bacterium]
MPAENKSVLLVIDPQMDYFPGGKFPLWDMYRILENIVSAIRECRERGIPVVIVQHVSESPAAALFARESPGVEIHPAVLEAAPGSPVVVKHYADSFHLTDLEPELKRLNCGSLLICGMMTQNCVTHTAISKAAEKYDVTVLADCCSTVSEMIHNIALAALKIRVAVKQLEDVFA